jgi:hypothetical protein
MIEFGKPPRAVLHIEVKEAYFHCGKALMRSKLWAASAVERSVMPSIGEVIHDQTGLGERESQEVDLRALQGAAVGIALSPSPGWTGPALNGDARRRAGWPVQPAMTSG